MIAKRYLIELAVAVACVVALVLAIVWWPRTSSSAAAQGEMWTCSMHPQVRLPGPGSCPICGMTLIPVSQLAGGQGAKNPYAQLETQAVEPRELFKEIQTVGKIDYSESRVEVIAARMPGRVDRLYVDFTGIEVQQNDHLVDLYSPELVSAQAELIGALEAVGARKTAVDRFAQANLESAREKLRLWGLLPEQIQEIEKTRKERTHVTIYAPLAGTVIEKHVRLGQYIQEGDPLYRIAELDPIWLYLDLYEYDIAWVRYGQPVDVTLEAYPGELFQGIVTFIDPFLDDRTRTIRVRVNLKNPEHRLKAGMYASATIRVRLLSNGRGAPTGLEGKFSCPMHPEVVQDSPGKCPICGMDLIQIPHFPESPELVHADHLLAAEEPAAEPIEEKVIQRDPLAIPASAVLDTGRRRIAYRQTPTGNFDLVELQIGPLAVGTDQSGRSTNYYPVLQGLSAGDRVVVRGGFLLDSQTQLEGRPSLLFPEGRSGANLHSGHGGHGAPGGQSGQDGAMPTPASGGHQH